MAPHDASNRRRQDSTPPRALQSRSNTPESGSTTRSSTNNSWRTRHVPSNTSPFRPRQENRIHDGHSRSTIPPATTKFPENNPPALQWHQHPDHGRPIGYAQSPRHQRIVRPEPWKDWDKLSVILSNVPRSWGTREIHELLLKYGACPVRIETGRRENRKPKIIFRPPPPNAWWIFKGLLTTSDTGSTVQIKCRYEQEPEAQTLARQLGEFLEVSLTGSSLSFGVLRDAGTMLAMRNVTARHPSYPRITANLEKQQLEVRFSLLLWNQKCMAKNSFCFRIPFTEIHFVAEDLDAEGKTCLTISLKTPPLAFHKILDELETHDDEVDRWDERQMWFRQTSIEVDSGIAAKRRTQLRSDSFLDIGRWLCYRLVCAPAALYMLQQFRVVLAKHNIPIDNRPLQCIVSDPRSQWDWLGTSTETHAIAATSSLDHISSTAVHLPFTVQYQLEACISHGCLHESNLDSAWLMRLLERDRDPYTGGHDPKYPRATKLLEKALETKQRLFNPADIFRLECEVGLLQKKIPHYCTMVRSATITPTTIYLNSPSVDTSNRVIRKFREHEDRFLRVKFRDESYKGTIMTFDDNTTDELFTKVSRTLMNGIVVGDRHYEFLAYGNSQFREHGAYFFAPTGTLTTAMIRDWMGDFKGIKTVAKYASRLGQCFSTTRAMTTSVNIERINDIERNGYCFTDGVGKISMFSLQMATQEMNLANSPSVIQFRLGGSKGVLAGDPSLRGQVIQIRPSQEKFPAPYKGLEICRTSQFATAYLNQQIVLVLSALGVPDEVFLVMLRRMLSKLQLALSDESVAMELLMRNIDANQSTVELGSMILDGFMAAQDPFFVSCLRLWRSWSTKYLKEKAKIFVEKGAFVMGTVDETGSLKGHSDLATCSDTTHDEAALPEVFLQVEDFNHKGTWKVIEGVCVLARNPSLHPGDARVVKAVDVPALRHYRDCVVLPANGDRDIASMCSGGDLDGDDYLVIWDPDLIPDEWNHTPMDYSAPTPIANGDPITIDDITKFFVNHMKYDSLGRIATAHRYWADKMEEGVKHENCLELAALHSKAVDYAKTGVKAEMPKDLKVWRWPHWAEKDRNRSYESKKILGQMYDEVERLPFEPAWGLPFDDRILEAFDLDNHILFLAREVKYEYDEAVRKLMTQHGVKTEFEIWTTFIMEHNHESRDFKIAEELGETMVGLKQQFQDICYEKAGTNAAARDWAKLKLFVAAMYKVTAEEIAAASRECESRHLAAGQWVPDRHMIPEDMPLMSFPWLFRRELGDIANGRDYIGSATATLSAIKVAGLLEPLKVTTPSISTASEAMQAPRAMTAVDRKDSMEIIRHDSAFGASSSASDLQVELLDRGATSPSSTSTTSNRQAGLLPLPELEVLDNILHESMAFDRGKQRDFGKGHAKINSLPVESSGIYDNEEFPPDQLRIWRNAKETVDEVKEETDVNGEEDDRGVQVEVCLCLMAVRECVIANRVFVGGSRGRAVVCVRPVGSLVWVTWDRALLWCSIMSIVAMEDGVSFLSRLNITLDTSIVLSGFGTIITPCR